MTAMMSMTASRKNYWLMVAVALPLATYFPIDSWQFWLIGLPVWSAFILVTRALPVFTERKRPT
jgi:hypothetical protein